MDAMTPESVKVKIMERDYVFACAPEEKESLLQCVALVDEKMSAIKNMGKLAQIDRIAVMAALMIANDLMAARAQSSRPEGLVGHTPPSLSELEQSGVDHLQEKLEVYLSKLKPQLNIEGKGLFN